MSLLISGVAVFILFMVVIMGVPILASIKRDMKWESSADKSIRTWYNR